MPNQLTPEELAEMGREYDHRIDAYFRRSERPNCDTETIGKLLAHSAALAEELDDERALAGQGIDHEFELMHKLKKAEVRAKEQSCTYIKTDSALPEDGRTVLLQPSFGWVLPEFGQIKRDKHGPYWQLNGHRATRYDIGNWKGWANLPKEPTPAPLAVPEAGAGQFPGMPEAKCHGCGLPSYALKCRTEGCPANPAVKKLEAERVARR